MTKNRLKSIMYPLQFKLGDAWSVAVKWPDGFVQEVGGFVCKSEAQEWIDTRSAEWLTFNPRKRSVKTL